MLTVSIIIIIIIITIIITIITTIIIIIITITITIIIIIMTEFTWNAYSCEFQDFCDLGLAIRRLVEGVHYI